MKNTQAIILLFISNIISGFAQGISMMAIPWYFVDVVARPSIFAYFYLFITFLTLFWGLYAGTIIDRYPRKKVFIYTNLVCGSVITLVSYYGFRFDNVPDFLVLLVFGLTIFNYNIHYPNLYAFGQEITEKKNYGRLNSYIEVQGQVTSMFAGAFAAILLSGTSSDSFSIAGIHISLPFTIEAWSIQKIFLMDAITYFIGIALFLFIKYTPIIKDEIHVGSLFSRLKLGFKYLISNPSIFAFGTLSYMLFAFTIVEIHVLLPSYVERFMNESANVYASAEVYYSLGAILSGVLVYRFLSKYNDFTNAFKIYRRKTLLKILPIVSEHFNVFLELPLKIIARKYKYSIIPINWKNRKIGKSNFKIKELSSMYLFTLCYCILEKILINYKNKK